VWRDLLEFRNKVVFLVNILLLYYLLINDHLERFDANFASGNLVSTFHLAFKSLKLWISKLLTSVDGSDPETKAVAKELASTSGTGTLDEWSSSEIFETRTWTGHVLSTTISTFGGVS